MCNEISKDELEWFQKYQEERAMIEEASFESEVRAKFEYLAEKRGEKRGEKIGEKRGIEKTRKSDILAFSKMLSPEEIANCLTISIEEVLTIIDGNEHSR